MIDVTAMPMLEAEPDADPAASGATRRKLPLGMWFGIAWLAAARGPSISRLKRVRRS